VPPGGREHRRAPRRPVLGNAVIRGPGFHSDCVIRDLSASGAKIQVRASIQLPDEFNLLLLEANTSRHVLLKWREGDFAGVAFRREGDASSTEEGEAAAIQSAPWSPSSLSAPPPAGTNTKRQIAPRRQVLGYCLVIANGVRANAIIRDVSATGAKVGINSRVKLPAEFYILDPKTNNARRVTLKWREGDFIGVHFCDPPPKEPKASAEDLSKVWHV
jgi:hypothetical protein